MGLPRSAGITAAWFALGMVCGLVLSVCVGVVASFFSGPIRGWNELGGPVYERNQTPLSVLTGLVIIALAIGIAAGLRGLNTPRGLVPGMLAAAGVLGVSVAFGM